MLVGFKRQFAEYVREGSKRHTVRGGRADKRLPHIGETLHCYADARQVTMELLGRWPCSGVERVILSRNLDRGLSVRISDKRLSPDEVALFLWRDGFRSFLEQPIPEGHHIAINAAYQFWAKNLRVGPWHGHIYHWAFDRPVNL
jgi:hypothetical protein